MPVSFIDFDLTSIHKPTIVILLAFQIILVVLLFLFYKIFSRLIPHIIRSARQQKSEKDINKPDITNKKMDDGEVTAAITMALYLHFNEIHDEESNVITIQRISKTYSPWSSKIYNMRNFR